MLELPVELSLSHHEMLVNIARRAIRTSLAGTRSAPTPPEDPALLQPAGCFVSLHGRDTHQLRGCVGRLEADQALYQVVDEVAGNVLHDPRFAAEPVELTELNSLEIEISVLSPLRSAAGPLDFDPARDGIYLKAAGQTGCFLPQVARQTGWSRKELLERLCTEKMGLSPVAWRDPSARLYLFSTLIVGPTTFNELENIHSAHTV